MNRMLYQWNYDDLNPKERYRFCYHINHGYSNQTEYYKHFKKWVSFCKKLE